MASTPIFPATIKSSVQQILPADTTAFKTLYTGGTNGTRIDAIFLSSTDTTNRDIQFYVSIGGTDYLLATVLVSQGLGNTNNVYSINAFQNLSFQMLNFDPNGNRYFYLEASAILKCKCTTTVTAAKVVAIHTQAGDY